MRVMWIFLVLTGAMCMQLSAAGFVPKNMIRAGPCVMPLATELHGQVVDEDDKSLAGANVKVKETSKSATTGSRGKFTIQAEEGQTLIVSMAGYDSREFLVGTDKEPKIQLELSLASLLNTVIVNKGYYTTTQKLNTGNVSTIQAADIEEQPVANPLAALEGRAPGVVVTQANGLPGAGFSVRIRGHNSIFSGNDPLFLIDGVPFTNTSISLGVASANGLQSPFNSINPGDIESIEILKDADATAIYGSRGANGVVLISTKKGKIGRTKLAINVYTGSGKPTRTMDLLNTQQYIEMRREAFTNGNSTPDISSAPDLVAWQTARYTDWKKLLIGGAALTTDAQAALSGGNAQTQFLMSSALHRETTVFPGQLADIRGAFHFNTTHNSLDNRFKAALTGSYSADRNNLIGQDLTASINTSPNAPAPYDSTGALNWSEGGVAFSNPFAYLLQKSTAKTNYLMSNLLLRYELLPGLNLKTNLGFNSMQLQQVFVYPGASLNPTFDFSGFAEYSGNSLNSWIVEPQAEYQNTWGKGKLELLAGTSFQQEARNGSISFASNFSSDALLYSPSAAGEILVNSSNTLYRYQAIFGRANYDWADKYVLNLTGRRDGSSRFGPDRQFANFGAIGAAWIFSKEAFIKHLFPALSYGKLRGSTGTTGNDQIGDYQYLNSYSPFSYQYQGLTGLVPTQLYNPYYGWETNRKSELGLELGALNDRIMATVSYYHSQSDNQLVNSPLPIQTGFSGIIRNSPATVQNTGWEYQLNTAIVKGKYFTWDASFNLTVARNKLLSFPDLPSSGYASTYAIGKPLTILKLVHSLGVDPQTGLFQFADKNGHTTFAPSFPDDYTVIKDLAPAFYGGFSNRFKYKGLALTIFFQFVKQQGYNYIYGNTVPGSMTNQPTDVLNRWRQPGDVTNNQLFTIANSGSIAYAYYNASDAAVSDASFIRLKNAELSYSLPVKWTGRIKTEVIRFYLQGQNLLTFTKYKGADPEVMSTAILPPLKVLAAGVQLTL